MRTLMQIAEEIRKDWTNPYYGAVPYLNAMSTLWNVNNAYFEDPGRDIVRYFLSNAQTWRGETAKRIKDELKSML